jgi:uncharacterized protein (TIRG00374 family)
MSGSGRERSTLAKVVRIAVIVVIVVALFVFARSVEWREVWRAMRGTSVGMLVMAAAVNLLSVALKGVRWWLFLRPIGVPSLPLAIRGTFVGAGLNNILIANGGEAARVVYVAREGGAPASGVLATLALERLFEAMGWAFTLSLAATVLRLPDSLTVVRPFAIGLLVVMVAFLAYLLRRPRNADVPAPAGEGWMLRARRFGRDFMQSMRAVASGPRFLGALLVSVAVWALQIATYHLTAVAAGLPISVVGTIACLLAVNIGFSLRATPGNVGVFQMVYAVTAVGFGVDKDMATGTAFLIQAQQILPVTLLGVALAPALLRRRSAERAASRVP